MRKGLHKIYTQVSSRYEFINHILTFGLDIRWRRKAAKEAAKATGPMWLDVCSGTGEMVQNLSYCAGSSVRIVAVDFCLPMLTRAMEKSYPKNIFFTLSEANFLPFPDETFDLVTISFATRNINHRRELLINHLREFLRVLKPGGCFVNLETSQPSCEILRKLFHFYVRLVVKPVGFFFSGSKAGYSYLSFTIPRFYPPDEFSLILGQAGFSHVSYRHLLFGISAIHTAIK
ncbi:MAG: ubiquinone/menaquinone biosynthesis methyltransferase [Candidatus Aminicenantaceae bacterium]